METIKDSTIAMNQGKSDEYVMQEVLSVAVDHHKKLGSFGGLNHDDIMDSYQFLRETPYTYAPATRALVDYMSKVINPKESENHKKMER